MTGEGEEIGFFASSTSEDPRYSVVFEDDGNVAYGYMMIENSIVSDVWLYNSGETPMVSPWDEGPDGLPFRNPSEFAGAHCFEPVKASDEIAFNWTYGNGGRPVAVEFWIRGKRHARITPESKPGWCVLALKDGPLARKLD